MILVVGGMAQGKLRFARKTLGVTAWSDGVLGEESCIYGLHKALQQLEEPVPALDAWIDAHPDGVIICDEVGCGVVPLDKADRLWREKVGRTCCYLADKAEKVYRVTCGLGVQIK